MTADPCECCGQLVVLVNFANLMKVSADMCAGETVDDIDAGPGGQWYESHERIVNGALWLALRPHTPELCERVRAGDPAPYVWSSNDDDGEGDE